MRCRRMSDTTTIATTTKPSARRMAKVQVYVWISCRTPAPQRPKGAKMIRSELSMARIKNEEKKENRVVRHSCAKPQSTRAENIKMGFVVTVVVWAIYCRHFSMQRYTWHLKESTMEQYENMCERPKGRRKRKRKNVVVKVTLYPNWGNIIWLFYCWSCFCVSQAVNASAIAIASCFLSPNNDKTWLTISPPKSSENETNADEWQVAFVYVVQ